LAKHRYGGKLVVTEYENIPHLNGKKFMEGRIKQAVKENADLFLAISQGAHDALRLEGVPEEKIQPFSGAVNVDVFTPGERELALRKSFGIPDDAFLVLYVGRLAKSKGTFTLLEAAKKLKTRDPNIHFLLAGKDEEGIAEWIAKNGVGSTVHLAGFIPYPDMPRYYRLADVFVLPSLSTKGWIEQFGYVLAEAMACGVAAVGSSSGAIPEVIGDPEKIFPEGSVDGMISVLLDVKKRGAKSEGLKARERAEKVYSSKNLAKKIKEVYWKLLAGTELRA
jgi:glycosyltransferase involved in cell wall biosynthesis